MIKTEDRERNIQILNEYKEVGVMQLVGDKYGITRERVRQIVSWELSNGEIPDGFHVCHHCDNPCCINPDHLFLGTVADNMHDRDAKGRGRYGENRPSLKNSSKLDVTK